MNQREKRYAADKKAAEIDSYIQEIITVRYQFLFSSLYLKFAFERMVIIFIFQKEVI
jgi:hypothetical protein